MSKLYDNLNRAVKCNKSLHPLHACRVIFKSYSNSVLINVFSRRATVGGWAKRFELNFFIRKSFRYGQFAQCPVFNETL